MSDEPHISLPQISAGDAAPGPWYSQGLQFACTQCGNCCTGGPGFVWLSYADMVSIAKFLDLPLDKFTGQYVRRLSQGFSLTERRNYDCIFLDRRDGKAMCRIYPVRPTQCRTWPFWNQNLASEQAWQQAAQRCPGMKAANGTLYSLPQIEASRTHPESP